MSEMKRMYEYLHFENYSMTEDAYLRRLKEQSFKLSQRTGIFQECVAKVLLDQDLLYAENRGVVKFPNKEDEFAIGIYSLMNLYDIGLLQTIDLRLMHIAMNGGKS